MSRGISAINVNMQFAVYGERDLNTHRETAHFQVKGYRCHQCEYSVAENIHLRHHEKTVYGKLGNYKCFQY